MKKNGHFELTYEGKRYTGVFDQFASAFIILARPMRILKVLERDTQDPPNPIRFKDETDMHPELTDEDKSSADIIAQMLYGTVAHPVEAPAEVLGRKALIHRLFEICPNRKAMPFYEKIASHAGESLTAHELVGILEESLISDGDGDQEIHSILLGKFPSFIAALSGGEVNNEAQKIFMAHFLSAHRKDDPLWKSC